MDLDQFLTQNPFLPWSRSHWLPVAIAGLLGAICIFLAKKYLSRMGQKRFLLALSLIPCACYFIYLTIKIRSGDFTIQDDLPVHLCRFLALMGPYVYWSEHKVWTGIFYFWIVVGTLNALVAVDLKYDFPHWSYILYFTLHSTLVLLPIYFCLVLGHRVERKDLWNAFLATNVFLLVAFVVNTAIGSNYLYVAHKPEVSSLLDYLGPWPWYVLALEFIGLLLFIVAYLPFGIFKKNHLGDNN